MLIARDAAELAAKKERHPDFDGVVGTPEMVVAQLKEYAAAGSQYVTFNLADAEDIAAILLLGEAVLPKVAEL
jgi:alkanesulfonate monooxygenase SsuD/methylene tetrahydromethanopterin reductase-like flavin-dependent oxidoreductase (luciferase family)